MCMAANRHRGVRAADCTTPHLAEMSRRHNDANVLCLAGRLLSEDEAWAITEVWLATPFEGGRHDAPRRAHRRRRVTAREPGLARVAARAALPPRPRAQRAAALRADPPAGDARAHRQRELRQPRRARGDGLGTHQQVRRGRPRGALLRRLRDRRPGRAARHRPLQASSSAPSTSTCSRTPGRRPTSPPCSPCSSPATASWRMALTHGGHLTHGLDINYSGRTYDVVPYHVRRDTETIDYDEVRALALASIGPSSSSAATAPTRASSTSPPSARSPTRSAPCCWPTSPTSRG